MAGDKYLKNSAGTITEQAATQTSAGAGDAGKIPALDGAGKLDAAMMPVGIGPDIAIILASEALAAGDFVNVYNNAGVANVRKADASAAGKEAHGFVNAAVLNGASATVYFSDENNQVTGATPGVVFLSATVPGGFAAAAPAGAGKVVQRLGQATSATNINFLPSPPIVLA